MKKLTLILLVVLIMAGCQPKLSPEELEAKWRGPIVASAFNVAACEGATKTAQKIQAGEIDGFAAFGELLGVGIIVQAVDEMLTEAEPMEDQADLLAQMQSDITTLRGVLGPWIDDEITSADVLETIDDICADTTKTLEQVADAAGDDGMTDEQMATLLEEVATAMQDTLETTE